jgi:hypothetical protein
MTAKGKGDNADCPEGVTKSRLVAVTRCATNLVESRITVTGTLLKAKEMRSIAKVRQRRGLEVVVCQSEFDAKTTFLLKARP